MKEGLTLSSGWFTGETRDDERVTSEHFFRRSRWLQRQTGLLLLPQTQGGQEYEGGEEQVTHGAGNWALAARQRRWGG